LRRPSNCCDKVFVKAVDSKSYAVGKTYAQSSESLKEI
jgi:hypothetical protein